MMIEMKLLDRRLGKLEYGTAEAAAIDLRACNVDGRLLLPDEPLLLLPGDRVKIGAGIALDLGSARIDGDVIPVRSSEGREQFFGFHRYAAFALPRSGLGSIGVTLGNAPGLLDADYQGEVFLAVWNAGKEPFAINALDRVAQLTIIPVATPDYMVVSEFGRTTDRGAAGFGSTGIH